jgi:molecular chaperone HtpG
MSSQKHEFQAEVKQVLDIVIHSLYTDKEIFIRELVSNASDSMEKMRLTQLTEKEVYDDQAALEIHITTDEEAKTLTIEDRGIGMSRAELVENLGTIAHSGSKAFAAALKNANQSKDAQLIGQFGVGFYSAFMVADEVKVYTHSWRKNDESLCWSSGGIATYEIEAAEEQRRGCKIVIQLKAEESEFAKADVIRRVLTKYSNFVSFPIHLNGEKVNTVEAVWLKTKDQVTEEEYKAFYQFTSKNFDEPTYRLHFQADAPLNINALLFLPSQNMELYGMGQTEPGVALYCKKVLIDPHPPKLLPEWLRFVRGIIDSEDLPLNISRESMQDSALVRKIGNTVSKRLIKHLDKESNEDSKKYQEFYQKFSRFIKEGVATDHDNQAAIAKLLRFESSMTAEGEMVSLMDYVKRLKDGQETIYYQVASSRTAIEGGPYVKSFKNKGLEVIYFYEAIDEYVISSLREFEGKKLMAVNSSEVDLHDDDQDGVSMSEEDSKSLCEWIKETFDGQIEEVRMSRRLSESPALVLTPQGEMTPQMRQMMKALNRDGMGAAKVIFELNGKNDIIHKLAKLKSENSEKAKLITEQLLDNALLSAGLLDDPQRIIERTHRIIAGWLN